MSHAEDRDPKSLKHRHDIGEPDHGPERTESTTKNIQILLGLSIAATAAVLIYTVLGVGFKIWIY